jgi:RNA polymerase-associated protein CTR9
MVIHARDALHILKGSSVRQSDTLPLPRKGRRQLWARSVLHKCRSRMVRQVEIAIFMWAEPCLEELAGAIHTLDKFLETPGGSKSLEATAMLASLRASSRPGVSSTELARDKARARELFDGVLKVLDDASNGIGSRLNRSQRHLTEDADMYCEVAALWVDQDLARSRRALAEAARAGGANVDPRVTNNLGAIAALEGDHKEARTFFETALTAVNTGGASSALTSEQAEAINTTVLYNLARAYEELGEDNLAKEAYDKLLTRHPEYVDGEC